METKNNRITFTLNEITNRFMNIELADGTLVEEFEVQETKSFDDNHEKLEFPILIGEDAHGQRREIVLDGSSLIGLLDTEEQGKLARMQKATRSDVEGMKAALHSLPDENLRAIFEQMIKDEEDAQARIQQMIADGVKPYQRKGGRR